MKTIIKQYATLEDLIAAKDRLGYLPYDEWLMLHSRPDIVSASSLKNILANPTKIWEDRLAGKVSAIPEAMTRQGLVGEQYIAANLDAVKKEYKGRIDEQFLGVKDNHVLVIVDTSYLPLIIITSPDILNFTYFTQPTLTNKLTDISIWEIKTSSKTLMTLEKDYDWQLMQQFFALKEVIRNFDYNALHTTYHLHLIKVDPKLEYFTTKNIVNFRKEHIHDVFKMLQGLYQDWAQNRNSHNEVLPGEIQKDKFEDLIKRYKDLNLNLKDYKNNIKVLENLVDSIKSEITNIEYQIIKSGINHFESKNGDALKVNEEYHPEYSRNVDSRLSSFKKVDVVKWNLKDEK